MLLLIFGKNTGERCTFVKTSVRKYKPSVGIYHFFTQSQPDAIAAILAPVVQALKNGKYLVRITLLETDAVVLEDDLIIRFTGIQGRKTCLLFFCKQCTADGNNGFHIAPGKLQCVT